MTPELKIEVGKFYRQRDGLKFHCEHIDGGGKFPVQGRYLIPDEGWYQTTKRSDGRLMSCEEDNFDLVSEWTDPVEMDWSTLPRWAEWVASDRSKDAWWWYELEPNGCDEQDGLWGGCGRKGYIPPAYAPKWTGDWKLSLTKVPRT